MSRAKPSFWLFLINKIYRTDLLFLWFVPLYALSSFIIFAFSPSDSLYLRSYIPLGIFSVLTFYIVVIGIRHLIAWKKFQKLGLVFANGAETIGEIIVVYFSRRHGYITYEYQYQQEKYRSTDSVNQNRKTRDITVGQQVMLYVNPQKPSQAFIRDLYLNTF